MSIDNTNLKNLDRDLLTTGFSPKAAYTYDAANNEVDVDVSASAFPAGVSLKRAHVYVHDKFGNHAYENIDGNIEGGSGPDTTTTIDVSSLNKSKGLDIKVTIIASDDQLVADGIATNIGAEGDVDSWDAQKGASPGQSL